MPAIADFTPRHCRTLPVHAARGERSQALAAYEAMGYELRIDQVRESIRALEAR
ncbi:hypothetical protein [Nocardiopsis alborubida]|uniref:Uncharacterized protein n=1 Tax=Nocardiopsis alborubida TaxID=146802 RepID=A0A7X6MBM6_9ACTN|nr:hypothetical protein [Nocardiopsis alborubida]NKY96765.1 hypothetical protein [Nocardiopsis alborubida]